MNLFNWIVPNKFKKAFAQAIYQYWISNGSENTMEHDPAVFLDKGYSQNISLYSIITRIDNMRKQAPMRLYKKSDKGRDEEVTDHELNAFLKQVNEDETFDYFVTQYLIYMLICGETFTYEPRIETGLNKGKTAELRMLPASDVEIIEGTPVDPIRGFRLTNGRYEQEFQKKDVYHAKLFNPLWYRNNTLHGLSPIVAANRTVSKLNEADITGLKQLENQGPKYALFRKTTNSSAQPLQQTLSTQQRENLEGKFKDASKASNRGLPLVLKEEFGKLDLGTSIADLALGELTATGVEALCALYGLPPELFGYGQKTYNNMGTARKAAWTDCIIPNMRGVENLLNKTLISGTPFEQQGFYFKMDYSEIEELQDGMKTKVEWMNAAGLPMNAIFEATGFGRVDNPRMDEPRVPSITMFLSDFDLPSELSDPKKDFSDYKK